MKHPNVGDFMKIQKVKNGQNEIFPSLLSISFLTINPPPQPSIMEEDCKM